MLPEHVTGYRWSSLRRLLKGPRTEVLSAATWLRSRGGWSDDARGLAAYADYLMSLAREEAQWESAGLTGLAKGWAIGTSGWKKALAKEYAQLRLAAGMSVQERKEFREATWDGALEEALRGIGRTTEELATRPRKQPWKLDLALTLRDRCGASIAWLAQKSTGEPF